VEETKNERLKYLLSQTDRYIEEITVKINQQRDGLKPTSNDDAAADNASPRAHNRQQVHSNAYYCLADVEIMQCIALVLPSLRQ
jgi:hypothetical protein